MKLPEDARLDYMWAIVNGRGGYNIPHLHQGMPWVSVYYVRVPEPAAALVFHGGGKPERVEAIPGRLVIFAGDQLHSVEANQADEDRVSISGNWNLAP